MCTAPIDSGGPTTDTRTARLTEVWEAANALAAAQMPKQLSGTTGPSDISFESNSVAHSLPIPLRHCRLVDVSIAPTSPSRWRLVARLCLIAVILTGGTSAVVAFWQLPLADIWRDHLSSWTQSDRPTSMMGRQQAVELNAAQVDQNPPASEPGLPALAQRQLDTDEVTVLLKRGKDLIAHGDFSGARVILKRAAEANNAEAALALASTYDPFVLRELKVYGLSGDTASARAWYEKAKELGSAVAPRRLEMLARETR